MRPLSAMRARLAASPEQHIDSAVAAGLTMTITPTAGTRGAARRTTAARRRAATPSCQLTDRTALLVAPLARHRGTTRRRRTDRGPRTGRGPCRPAAPAATSAGPLTTAARRRRPRVPSSFYHHASKSRRRCQSRLRWRCWRHPTRLRRRGSSTCLRSAGAAQAVAARRSPPPTLPARRLGRRRQSRAGCGDRRAAFPG
jgi:hypothetical protein